MSVSVAVDPLTAIRQQLEDCLADPDLETSERVARLRDLRERIIDLVGVADRYLSSTEQLRESAASAQARDLLWARGNADLRETLIDSGEWEARELDEAGFLSHRELDRLDEEGLLVEAVAALRRDWEEAKHPRGHGGKFSHTDFFKPHEGSILASTDRLRPTRSDSAEHVEKARRYAHEGRKGLREKRKPLDVRENGDGTLAIIDGNSTYAALKDQLDQFPVTIGQGDAGEDARSRVADEVFQRAVKAEPSITPTMKTVVAEHGGSLQGLDYRIKSRDSIASKITRKQEKYPGMTADQASRKVLDQVRYTATFDPDSYVEGTRATMKALEAQGLKLRETKNYWGGTDDYDGFHALYENADHVPVELQFHTPDSFKTKEGANHKLFEEFRDSHDSKRRYELWDAMVANNQKLERPLGVEALGPRMDSPSLQQRRRRKEDDFGPPDTKPGAQSKLGP